MLHPTKRVIKAIQDRTQISKTTEEDYELLRDYTNLFFLGGYTLKGLQCWFEAHYDETINQLSQLDVGWNHEWGTNLQERLEECESMQRVKDEARLKLGLTRNEVSANRYYHYHNIGKYGLTKEDVYHLMYPMEASEVIQMSLF